MIHPFGLDLEIIDLIMTTLINIHGEYINEDYLMNLTSNTYRNEPCAIL